MTDKALLLKIKEYAKYLEWVIGCSQFDGPPGTARYMSPLPGIFKDKFKEELKELAAIEKEEEDLNTDT